MKKQMIEKCHSPYDSDSTLVESISLFSKTIFAKMPKVEKILKIQKKIKRIIMKKENRKIFGKVKKIDKGLNLVAMLREKRRLHQHVLRL